MSRKIRAGSRVRIRTSVDDRINDKNKTWIVLCRSYALYTLFSETAPKHMTEVVTGPQLKFVEQLSLEEMLTSSHRQVREIALAKIKEQEKCKRKRELHSSSSPETSFALDT